MLHSNHTFFFVVLPPVKPVLKFLISFVIMAVMAVKLSPLPPLAHTLQYSAVSDAECNKGLDSFSAKLLEPGTSGWLTCRPCQSHSPTRGY